MVLQRQLDHGVTAEARRHAGARDQPAQMIPHDEILGVDLGELVHVDAADDVAQRLGEREHRQLDEIEIADERVEHLQFVRMDEILRVMQRNPRVRNTGLDLVGENCGDDQVEAIGLAGRAVARNHHHPDIRVERLDAADLCDRRRVVLIDADEILAVAVDQQARIGGHHREDDVVLLPRRHHDGERAFRQVGACLQQARERRVLGLLLPGEPEGPVVEIDEDVVDAADRRDHGDRDRQDLDVIAIFQDRDGQCVHVAPPWDCASGAAWAALRPTRRVCSAATIRCAARPSP